MQFIGWFILEHTDTISAIFIKSLSIFKEQETSEKRGRADSDLSITTESREQS